ncbi:hypothetical protein B0H66DRAFT_536108 [Apodospora peruviana]|uniref:DSBA-like thioredoxin domain-containing protein n=1 Tax=Apodospora peruviana TaxID=516989 RepID=A0AAE0HYL7_9PEZI|nr:hypothetical protein B0H66DRAFT_536108 [Apodospora peruviana]
MAVTRPNITLYVDTVSPFSYLAYYVLRHDSVFLDCTLTFIPMSLADIMQKVSWLPNPAGYCSANFKAANLALEDNKDKWTHRERMRWADAFAVPMNVQMPPNFPPSTEEIMSALSIVAEEDAGKGSNNLVKCLDELYRKYWVELVPTFESRMLEDVLGSVLSAEEAKRILALASTRGKQLLAHNTDLAFAAGAFGLPWVVCTRTTTTTTTITESDTEGFFGVDHLGLVARFLNLGDISTTNLIPSEEQEDEKKNYRCDKLLFSIERTHQT